jgi:hypothetical protein
MERGIGIRAPACVTTPRRRPAAHLETSANLRRGTNSPVQTHEVKRHGTNVEFRKLR